MVVVTTLLLLVAVMITPVLVVVTILLHVVSVTILLHVVAVMMPPLPLNVVTILHVIVNAHLLMIAISRLLNTETVAVHLVGKGTETKIRSVLLHLLDAGKSPMIIAPSLHPDLLAMELVSGDQTDMMRPNPGSVDIFSLNAQIEVPFFSRGC